MNDDIKRHLKNRNKLHRKALKSKQESDWKNFKAERRLTKSIIRKAQAQFYQKQFSKAESKTTFQIIKKNNKAST
jgi:chorismate mutase